MNPQNYKNHKRYYTPHHFIFYPVALLLFIISIYEALKNNESSLQWWMFAAIIGLITSLAYMLRQHYALGNQNRIVRLEVRFRYYRLTHKNFEEIEKQLTLSQILALRFASDQEFVELAEKAVNEKLSPNEIKKQIKNWVPDYLRA